MNETPVSDAAVQIVRKASPGLTRLGAVAAVAALAREGWLHDPASYSEQSRAEVIALISRQAKRIAELEADLLKIEGFRADLADRCFRKGLELDAWRTGEHPTEGTS